VNVTTVSSLARLLGARPPSSPCAGEIRDLANPADANAQDVTVLFDEQALRRVDSCDAAVVVCAEDCPLPEELRGRALRVPDPGQAFVQLLQWFHPPHERKAGLHPSAVVHSSATIGQDTHVGPLVVVEEDAEIGEGSVLSAHSYVGPGASLGRGCRLEPGVRILAGTVLGDGVQVDSGSIIGSRGFGYLPADADGIRAEVPQVGRVVVGDGAHIGALCCIDRGTLGDTVIGAHARIDNLVQVAHNCSVGAGAVLVAQVGLAGSVTVGNGALLAGQSGVADHRTVGAGAVLSARAAAFRDVPEGEVYGGFPARPHNLWLQEQAQLSQLRRSRRTQRKAKAAPARQPEEEADAR